MSMIEIGRQARAASRVLALASHDERNQALFSMAHHIRQQQTAIVSANQLDMEAARQKQLPAAFLDRLSLDEKRIEGMARSLEILAELPDPVNKVLATISRPNQLRIEKVSVPIGVMAVIYESRPNVTTDAAGLCLKSGNAVILRGGSESFHSAALITQALHAGLQGTSLPWHAIQMIPTTSRSAIDEMLKLDEYIDVIIPRGGMKLIESIAAQTRIPLIKHLAGINHTYVHAAADREMARKIVFNAKMRRPGICGATEILLVDEAIAATHLPIILSDLLQSGCEVRGDDRVMKLHDKIIPVHDEDYSTEFLDTIIAVKIVKDISHALAHIAQHGSQHTEAIITEDEDAAERFLQEVDSAIVMHNASTQFADGGEFGMGAEMGIATGKLHARGPVGVEQLTTFKYKVHGQGQTREG